MRYKKSIYSILQFFDKQILMFNWCLEMFGSSRINWKLSNGKFYFRFKKDYAHFLLRWA